MPKYLIQADFTTDGVKGILKDGGSKRKTAVKILMKELGGNLEGFTTRSANPMSLLLLMSRTKSQWPLCRWLSPPAAG